MIHYLNSDNQQDNISAKVTMIDNQDQKLIKLKVKVSKPQKKKSIKITVKK